MLYIPESSFREVVSQREKLPGSLHFSQTVLSDPSVSGCTESRIVMMCDIRSWMIAVTSKGIELLPEKGQGDEITIRRLR